VQKGLEKHMKMSNSRVAHLLVMMVLAFLPLAARAGQDVLPAPVVPRLVEFRGALKDAEGKPRPGLFSLTFALYSQGEGGEPIWAETQAVRVGADGGYGVLLGSATNGGVPAEALISTSNSASSNLAEGRWLGIQVEQEEEQTPRVVLVSVPFALKSADSERLGGKSASDFVRVDQLSKVVPPIPVSLGSTASGAAAGAAANNKVNGPAGTSTNVVAVPAVTKSTTPASGTTMQFTYTFFDSNTDLPAVTVPGIYVDLAYAFTIQKVYCQINGGSATINLTNNGSNILSSGLACTTSGATSSSFNSGRSSIAAGNQIGHVTTSAGAGLRCLNVVIEYTVN
jgi:hypothetical protein